MTDIHTHILYDIDDGPETLDDSINLIKNCMRNGVKTLVATSHFYPVIESMENYVSKRLERLSKITERLKEEKTNVEIIPGAEVQLSEFLLNHSSIKDLCYGGGRHILLELPKKKLYYNECVQTIERVMSYFNVVPIIAHVERYNCFLKNLGNVAYLKDMGCVIQVDADSFFDKFSRRRFCYNMLKNNLIDVVGSDCHHVEKRGAILGAAYSVIAEKVGKDVVDMLKNNANMLVGK